MATGISPENERFIEQAVANGQFASRDEAFNKAVGLLREELELNEQHETARCESAEEWIADFHAWAESHRHLPHEADDSRESIYAGRGE